MTTRHLVSFKKTAFIPSKPLLHGTCSFVDSRTPVAGCQGHLVDSRTPVAGCRGHLVGSRGQVVGGADPSLTPADRSKDVADTSLTPANRSKIAAVLPNCPPSVPRCVKSSFGSLGTFDKWMSFDIPARRATCQPPHRKSHELHRVAG